MRLRSKLSTQEAPLLREVFPDILAAHYTQVWDRLRRRGLSRTRRRRSNRCGGKALADYTAWLCPPEGVARALTRQPVPDRPRDARPRRAHKIIPHHFHIAY